MLKRHTERGLTDSWWVHSLGGLFAIHTLLTRPDLFNAYMAIDPSLQWNNEALVGQAEEFLSRNKALRVDLYFTSSNFGGTASRGTPRLAAILDEKAPEGFRWHFEWMKDEIHATIPLRSLHEGLDTIFYGWHLTDPVELFDKGGLAVIDRHFREGAKRYGYDRTTPSFIVSLLVAELIRHGRLEEAAQVLLHDPETYPAPWNELDALARAYSDRGNNGLAARYYLLSLKANPQNDWARRKLREMGVQGDDATQKPPQF
jgi:pimeloyl-ACP methyl ester carboxylesterase